MNVVSDIGSAEMENSRDYMQDRHLIEKGFAKRQDWHLCAIFDGHGIGADGHRGAEIARRLLPSRVKRYLAAGMSEAEAVRRAYFDIDAIIETQNIYIGTTALTAFIHGRLLTVLHTGDCRAILLRGNDPLTLTKDHTIEHDLQRIQNAGLTSHIFKTDENDESRFRTQNGGLNVARSLGDLCDKEVVIPDPDVIEETLTPQDQALIMVSDGVGRYIDHRAVSEIMRQAKTAAEAAQRFNETAKQAGSTDNLTSLVVKFDVQ